MTDHPSILFVFRRHFFFVVVSCNITSNITIVMFECYLQKCIPKYLEG